MNGDDPSLKLVDGKYVLLAVFALGLAGAGGGWWYHQAMQRRPLALWGQSAAILILRANDAEICRLQPSKSPSASVIVAGGPTYAAVDCKRAAETPGLLHLRHSLLNDHSFDWGDPAEGDHNWRYVLRFREQEKIATVLISADFEYATLAETGAQACIRPLAAAVKSILDDPKKSVVDTP